MIFRIDRTGQIEAFRTMAAELASRDDVKSLLILACDDNGFTPATVDPILSELDKPVFGGIFPEIIHDFERLAQGCIMVGLSYEACVQVVTGLSDQGCLNNPLEPNRPSGDIRTMFVFVDGLAEGISGFLQTLVPLYGLGIRYIGGGAGSLSFEHKPCLFTPRGLIQDGAVLALSAMPTGVGVSHGWNSIAGPFRVTESRGNTIYKLDHQPAFEVYREAVQDHGDKVFADDNFFDIAKYYPFGINKLSTDRVVRDPIKVGDSGSLVCVGEVPQGCLVHILNGDKDSLVSAARYAAALSRDSFVEDRDQTAILLIDCISRVLLLEDHFERELDAVAQDGLPLVGAATMGEIATYLDGLEFHNKTSVVGLLQDCAI